MSGFLEDLSEPQAEALSKFKAAVTDIPNKPEDSDRYYLRWLRARKFNVEKALDMFQKHLEFREENGVGTPEVKHWTPPDALLKYYPRGHFGEDREGRPVWYYNLGNVDPRGIFKSIVPGEREKFNIFLMENMLNIIKEHSRKNGPHIEAITQIVDLEHLSFQKHYYRPGLQASRKTMAILEANYPEILHRMVIVKAPKVFPFFYNLIKPFLDKKTRQKIIVLSGNWKEELQKYISPDQLPQAYGGTRCEPDEWCSDHIIHGGAVPPELYLTNQTEMERQEMDRVVVGRGGSCELEYEVELEGSLIRWEFVSTGYDVSYGLLQKESSSKNKPKLEPVVPFKRTNSHVIPEAGVHTCAEAGSYVFKFDNSYSWVHSKEVFYSIQVLPPNTEPDLPDLTAEGPPNVTMMIGDSSDDEEFYDCDVQS